MSSRPLKDRIGSLLNDPSKADVTFVVGEEKVHFPAHSVVMSTASDPFSEMFFGNFNRERVVEIPDASPDGFRALLKYIYTDEVDLTDDDLASVLYLADKYLVTDLFERCVRHVTAANVCRFLPLAELYAVLSELCCSIALSSGDEVLSSEYFLDLSEGLFAELLGSGYMKIDEKTVFNRAVDWAKRRLEQQNRACDPTSIRATLGDALCLIRFPLFNVNDFADGPFASGILTDKECFSLLVWFLTRKGPLLFSTKVRSGTDAVADVNWDREAQDFDLCANRFNEGEHPHPAKEICVLLGVDAPQSADPSNSRAESIQRCMDSLEHACECSDANCSRATCRKMKNVVQHAKLCKKRPQQACPLCKQVIGLCCCHAQRCDVDVCPVVFCSSLRQKHQEQKLEKTRARDLLRDKCEAARASCGHTGVHWICFACYERIRNPLVETVETLDEDEVRAGDAAVDEETRPMMSRHVMFLLGHRVVQPIPELVLEAAKFILIAWLDADVELPIGDVIMAVTRPEGVITARL